MAVTVGLTVALFAGAPGVAAAAEGNLPPDQPRIEDLTTTYKPCADDPVYVGAAPTLRATVTDPEEDNAYERANSVGAEFEAWWTGADGAEQRRTLSTGLVSSPHAYQWQMPSDLPADTEISWHVRARDDEGALSAWSDEGDGRHACGFIIDAVNPEAPTVTSEEFQDSHEQTGHVGEYGSFTFDSPSEDVVEYDYTMLGGPTVYVRPEEPGGPVTVRWMPEDYGPYYVQVHAIDRAGRSSDRATYDFWVSQGRAPIAHWALDDPAGTTDAAAEAGPAAQAGDGVTFGAPAPSRTTFTSTVTLTGQGNSYLTPGVPATDTAKTFAVSGWVRPGRTDTAMTLASQDVANDASAFTLGLRPADGSGANWSFRYGSATVSGGTPSTGEWAHLLGLYNAEDGSLRLYVNGVQVATETGVAPVTGTGAFQIGRARGDGGARWQGEIGDVRVWDRVVVPEEITALSARTTRRVAGWDLETAQDGVSPEMGGGEPLTLHGGATLYSSDFDALRDFGHLDLDGIDGYAATSTPVVDTGDSFSVGATVRLADQAPAGPMTVLSQGDADGDAFKVRYDPASHEWQLIVTQGSGPDAGQTKVGFRDDPAQYPSQQVVAVYDKATDRITLYLDGQAVADAEFHGAWTAPGPLQIGRGHTADGSWGEYLHGAVDAVRVFEGALASDRVVFYDYL